MAEDKGAKTEQPTARRLGKARQEGQVAKSMEINTFVVLISGLFILFFAGGFIYHHLSFIMIDTLSHMAQISIDGSNLTAFLTGKLKAMGVILAPIFIGIPIMAFAANFFQVGALFTTKPLEPKVSKLNPIKGFSKLFSKRSLMEMLKSIGKIVIVGSIAYLTVRGRMKDIMILGDMDPRGIALFVMALAFEIFLKTLWVLAVLAIIDYIFQKWQYMQDMKMTKEEVKEEFKQTEGDPLVKSRIRSAQREAARKRMMAKVPEADVVVTNPIHLAVALLYDAEQADAPMVVAKGQALIAEKIKEIAKEHDVPIMEDKPLAQALYKSVEIGETIPVLFYQAVAEILAYVYRMKGKRVHGGSGR